MRNSSAAGAAGRTDQAGYSYGWLVNGKRKRGATGRTMAITRALHGRSVQCKVTASNAAGAATAVSRPLRIFTSR